MKPALQFLAALSVMVPLPFPAHAHDQSIHRPQGFVPDAKTAITIAVAVWVPIYGEQKIASEKPFIAKLSGGNWTVTGSLPKGWNGGVAIAVISKQDGRVVLVNHGK